MTVACSAPGGRVRRRRRGRCDDGVATVLVLGLASLLVLVGCLTVALGAVAVARQRSASAADLSALAAAERALSGRAAA